MSINPQVKALWETAENPSLLAQYLYNLTLTSSNLDTKISASVAAAVAALVDSAPAALNTLNELAASLANDAHFATTITTALSGKEAVGVAAGLVTAHTTTYNHANFLSSNAVTGTFTTSDGKTVTVAAGQITAIIGP